MSVFCFFCSSLSYLFISTWSLSWEASRQDCSIVKWAASWQNEQNGVRPAKTQINLGIRPIWSESLLCTKDPRCLHVDSKDSDQTGWMPRLIWVFAERTCHFWLTWAVRLTRWAYSIPLLWRPLSLSSLSTMFKHLLLWNGFANQSQILYGASLGRGNENLYKCSRSHDQGGHHAHIW